MNSSENSSDTTSGEKERELDKLRQEIANCFDCPLSKTRNNTVPGEGSATARIMFIGEAPGAKEDEKGIPFCGASGKFLDEMLENIGLARENVFIANTLKCRPPANRDPEDSEKETCRHFLDKQFEIINPDLVVPMGKHAVANFLPGVGGITALHGRVLKRPNGKFYFPLYHPAAALHNGGLRSTLIEDFNKIPAILEKIELTKKAPTLQSESRHGVVGKKIEDNIEQQKLI